MPALETRKFGRKAPVGTVEPYASAAGKRYRVRYRKPDHSQTTKRGFTTKKEAELFLASVELGKAPGRSSIRRTPGSPSPLWARPGSSHRRT
ncbi:Arm DNA-binding domain-containing protein [Agromyces bauzanensis]